VCNVCKERKTDKLSVPTQSAKLSNELRWSVYSFSKYYVFEINFFLLQDLSKYIEIHLCFWRIK
jgi:hypothetical protein